MMDISKKQAKWALEKPLFEAELIHSHLLPYFDFNSNTGDYELKSEYSNDEDRKLAYEVINTGWSMWLRAKSDAKAQAVPEGFVVFPKKQTSKMRSLARDFDARLSLTKYEQLHNIWVKQGVIEAQEPTHDQS